MYYDTPSVINSTIFWIVLFWSREHFEHKIIPSVFYSYIVCRSSQCLFLFHPGPDLLTITRPPSLITSRVPSGDPILLDFLPTLTQCLWTPSPRVVHSSPGTDHTRSSLYLRSKRLRITDPHHHHTFYYFLSTQHPVSYFLEHLRISFKTTKNIL